MSYKKIRLLILALVLMTACQKDDTSNAPVSTWTVGNTTYTSTNPASFSSGTISAMDNNLNSDIEITFPSRPTMNGSYPVTELDSSLNGSSICVVNINTPSVSNYKGTGSEMVAVSLNNGKVTASFSNMQMRNGSQTAIASGTIIEK